MRVPRLLDVSVPLAAGVPAYPGNPEFEMYCLPWRIAGADGAPARVVLKR
jgi:kynurenine formamidase